MDDTIQRAFELASSGTYAGVDEVKRQLKKEGFDQVEAHLSGFEIKRQLFAGGRRASASFLP